MVLKNRLALMESKKSCGEAHHASQDAGPDRIQPGASEKQGKAESTQKTARHFHEGAVASPVLLKLPEPVPGQFRIGFAVADGPAHGAELIHRIQVVAMLANPAHQGHGFSLRRFDADGEIVGNGKNLGLQVVGLKNPDDAFFNPVGFGSGHGQLVAQFHRKIQQ